jgi:hypothetical protein
VQSDYVVKRGDQEIGAFPTLQDAETRLREIEPETFKQAEQQAQVKTDDRVTQLKNTLTPMLAKFGLQDVGLNVVDRIENDAGGSYLDSLINISLTEENPIQTMRHEALHALKDLQFFTPQQYKALEERANKQWIKEYLQDQMSDIEVDGKVQTMSRLDAYKKLGYTQEAIVEEAIADAFGAYARGATPPPGMIAALFKKLKNFFLNFGQALRGAGFESADDVTIHWTHKEQVLNSTQFTCSSGGLSRNMEARCECAGQCMSAYLCLRMLVYLGTWRRPI